MGDSGISKRVELVRSLFAARLLQTSIKVKRLGLGPRRL